MRLISCTIENFGKLNNVTYDFTNDCNTICEDNGWGKSTLASFIRVMFFGFKNETKKKLVDKERNRLMPWQKGVYGGEIVFEANGIVYSLRRTFGKKQADDEFLLRRKDTNMECDDFSSEIGEELFKIDAQSFERTVFIGQSDCVTATTDSINAKIGNLADNTDDINNFETAVGRLTAELNNITSTRVTGSIAKRKSAITQLQAQINNYSEIDKTIDEQMAIRDDLCRKRDALKADKEKMQEQQRKLSAQKDVQALKEKYQLLVKECDVKKKTFENIKGYFNEDVPKKEDVLKEMSLLDEAGRMSGKISHSDGEGSGMYNGLSVEEQDKLEQLKKRFNKGIPNKNKVGQIHDIWASAQNRQNGLVGKEMKLDIARENQNVRLERAAAYKNTGFIGLIAGIIAAVAGVVLLFFVMPAGIAMIVAGLCIAGIFTAMGAAKKKQHEEEFQSIKDESEKKIKAIEDDINDDKSFIAGTEKAVRQFCEEYGIVFNRDNVAWELSGLNRDIDAYHELGKRISEEQDKQQLYRKEYNKQIEDITHFLKLYIKDFNQEESIGEMLRNLDKKLDEYYRAKTEYENALAVKAGFEAETDISIFSGDESEADKVSLEELAGQMMHTDNMIEEYLQQIEQCNKQLESLQVQSDECENCRHELEELQNVQEEEKNKERLLKLTKQIMEDSKQSFTSEYMGPVMAGFRKYYTILTGCEPDAYSLDADTKLTVMEQNMPRDIGYLSAGKQDLVGICMRMALVEAMYKEEKPFLIFDDPFVNLDDNNIKGAMKLLDEIAKDYQVIYFTCSESRIYN